LNEILQSLWRYIHLQFELGCDTYEIFPAVITEFSCSWKQLFDAGSAIDTEHKSLQQNHFAEHLH